MRKSDTWMPLYIGDYLGDTSHLTTEQHGAYLLLLMALWKRGGDGLPDVDENLAAAARLPVNRWKAARAVLIDGLLLRSDGKAVSQKRLGDELDKANGITEARSKAGANGAAKREANKEAKQQANDKQTTTPSPSQSQRTSPPPSGAPPSKPKASKRCPTEFLVDGELQRWAREKAPLVDIRAETEAFRDCTFPKAHDDWPATWRGWMRREQKRLAEKRPVNGAVTDVGYGLETLAERAKRERIAELTGGLASRQPTHPPGPPLPALAPPETFHALEHDER